MCATSGSITTFCKAVYPKLANSDIGAVGRGGAVTVAEFKFNVCFALVENCGH